MPSNWSVFRTLLKTHIKSLMSTGPDDSAKKVASAYNVAVIGQATTMYGNIVLSGNTSSLQRLLASGIQLNHLVKDKSEINPYRVMAMGFISYWTGAVISPFPPNPPCIAPSSGIQVVFPGEPMSLAKNLQRAFQTGELDRGVEMVILALQLHMKTITGIYNGMIPTPTGPVPSPPIPWIGIDVPIVPVSIAGGSGSNASSSQNVLQSAKDALTVATALANAKSSSPGGGSSTVGNTSNQTGGTSNGSTPGGVTSGGQSGGTQSNNGSSSGASQNSSGGTTPGGTNTPGGSSTGVGGNTSNSVSTQSGQYVVSSDVYEVLKRATDDVFSQYNTFGLRQNYTKVNSKVQLVVFIRERVIPLLSNELEFQYEVHVQLNNLAVDMRLLKSQPNLPTAIGESTKYTFKRVITKRSEFLDMVEPVYRNALSEILTLQISNYAKKWYYGAWPSEILDVEVYMTTSTNNNQNSPFDFYRLNKTLTLT